MASSPPSARDTDPLAQPALAEATFRAEAGTQGVIFFCVEDAPREACRTRSLPDGSLVFDTRLTGEVIEMRPGELRLDVGSRRPWIRHLLPAAVDLSPLRGQIIHANIEQRYAGRGRATIDAELTDSCGRPLLWAHDGRLPQDRLGIAFRLTLDSDGHRVAVGHAGGVASVRAPDLVQVRSGIDRFTLALLRAGADDISFVMLPR